MLEDISSRPYILRAVYEWCVDKHYTPHLIAQCQNKEKTKVPEKFIVDSRIVLNISPIAVRLLAINDKGVFFTARFLGETMEVSIALEDILAIYAKETGKGIAFPEVSVRNEENEERNREYTIKKNKLGKKNKTVPDLNIV